MAGGAGGKPSRRAGRTAAADAGLVAWLLEALAPLGGVAAKRMFGGHGLFQHGLMFALVARDAAWFRADAVTEPEYRAAGCGPFEYQRAGRTVALAYWQVPAAVLDDPEALCAWARLATAAAARAKAARR